MKSKSKTPEIKPTIRAPLAAPVKARVLFVDIETAPNIITAFSLEPQKQRINFENIIHERYILTAAWKWLGESKIYGTTVRPHSVSDRRVVEELSAVISKADVIVGHWGTGFDFPWIRGRLLFHRMPPLAPVKEFDTCKWAQRVFLLNSCKLDYLAKYLGVGGKVPTNHSLWQRCLLGDPLAFDRMLRYNKHDVRILERVFKIMRPHLPPAINYRFFSTKHVCTHCGSDKLQRRGSMYTLAFVWHRYQCQQCGAWHRGSKTAVRKAG